MQKNWKNYLDLVFVLILFVIVNVFSYIYQKPITYRDGKGWDGVYYYEMAKQISKGEQIASKGPFVFRIGSPFLAAMLGGNDLIHNFFISNIFANTLVTILLYLWFRNYFNDWRIRVILMSLFLLHWLGPIRFTYFYPLLGDPWVFVFTISSLLLVKKIESIKNWITVFTLSVLLFIGVMFRETLLLIPLSLFFISNPIPKDIFPINKKEIKSIAKAMFQLHLLIPFVAAVLGLTLVYLIAHQTDDYSPIKTAGGAAYARGIFEFILACFISYGPIIALCIYSWKTVLKFLWDNQFLFAYLLLATVAAWSGGIDVERYLLSTSPVIYLLIGVAIIENFSLLRWTPLTLLMIVSQLMSERVFWTLPDHPNQFQTPFPILTILSSQFQLYDMSAIRGKHFIQIASLIQYVILTVVILLLLNRVKKRSLHNI